MSEQPTRRELNFPSEDDVIADVERLRRGYVKTGNWTLPQTCWHLEKGVRFRMAPGPHAPNTPEQDARAPIAKQVLATGKLPKLDAPDTMVAPPETGDDAIDSFIGIMREFKAFPGPIAPHRLFGHLPQADARRLNLIHCAHHLSYLVPTSANE